MRWRFQVIVASNMLVHRVVFEEAAVIKTAGVEVIDISGKTTMIPVERNNGEVVLACGAIGTPHCLMLSGIGPEKELNSQNIPLVANIDGVGKNLMDHGICQVIVR